MKLFITLSYLGTDFCGYQAQKDKRTVQSELNRASFELFGYECDITGCSRTDSGVHANMFCATVTRKDSQSILTELSSDKIPMALNAHLPPDISVFDAEFKDDDFHPRYDVKYKEYIYRIYNSRLRSPFEEGRAWQVPYSFTDFDIERMDKASKLFVGKHNFEAFMAQGSNVESTVRNIVHASVERQGDIITFRVSADGFLYNMVRILTGTLVDVGRGKISPDEIEDIILSCDRARAGATAPAHGLYLNKVVY